MTLLSECARVNERCQPLIDGHINNEMNSVVIATIGDHVRITEAQVPALSLGHKNSPAINSEVDRRIAGDWDVQPSDPVFERQVIILMLFYG